MTEAELLSEVRRLAEARHLLLFHVPDSRVSLGRGFPDLVIAGPTGTVFAELKTNGNTLSPDQRHWGSILGKSGQRWYVWRPRDLGAGVIERTLDSLSIFKQLTMDGEAT